MGGGGSTQQTNQVSTMQLPPWFNDAAQQNYAYAQAVANRPLQQYQGATVADLSPQTQQAWQQAQNVGSAGADYYNAAGAGLLSSLKGGASPTVTPGLLAKTDLDPYMNPFTNDVIKNSLNTLESQRQQSIMGNADTAVKAGAFGGSRQGITDAVTNAQSAIGAGNLAAQLNSANFQQAQAGATGDLQRMLAAAQGNQQAAATQGAQNLSALGQLKDLGNISTTNATNQVGLLSNIGEQQQKYAQSQIDANVNKFNQAWDYPTQQLNTLLSALGMTPHGYTQTSEGETKTQSQPNIAQGILGGLQSVMGLMGGGAASDEIPQDRQAKARHRSDNRAHRARLPLQRRSEELSEVGRLHGSRR